MQPERTAGCHTPAGTDRRRCKGQVASRNRRAQGQGGAGHRRSVGWRSFGIHEGSVPADDGPRRQDQAGRCDEGRPAAAGPQEERGTSREEEGRGVKIEIRAWGRRFRLPHNYRSVGVVLALASIRLNIKRSTGLAVALAVLGARKRCWKFWAEETSLPQTGIPCTAVSVRPTARIPIVQTFFIIQLKRRRMEGEG